MKIKKEKFSTIERVIFEGGYQDSKKGKLYSPSDYDCVCVTFYLAGYNVGRNENICKSMSDNQIETISKYIEF